MSLGGFNDLSSEPGVKEHLVQILGTGAANPTVVFGAGITITWVSTGRYRFVWKDNPGTFVGVLHGFQATTPADLDGYTIVAGAYNTSTWTVDVYVYSDTPALADLQALGWLLLKFQFKTTAVKG